MAAINFPAWPALAQTHHENGVVWQWNGECWERFGDRPAGPPAAACAYCGRDDAPDYRHNCHGCGAPRQRVPHYIVDPDRMLGDPALHGPSSLIVFGGGGGGACYGNGGAGGSGASGNIHVVLHEMKKGRP